MLILRHTQIFSKAILFGWALGTEDFRLKLSSALQQLNVEACELMISCVLPKPKRWKLKRGGPQKEKIL